jgi:hypothetical protein
MKIGLSADPQSKLRRLRTSKKQSSAFTESKEKKRWTVRCRNNRNMEINQRRSEVQMTIGLLSKNKATKHSQRGVNTEKEGVQSGAVCSCGTERRDLRRDKTRRQQETMKKTNDFYKTKVMTDLVHEIK